MLLMHAFHGRKYIIPDKYNLFGKKSEEEDTNSLEDQDFYNNNQSGKKPQDFANKKEKKYEGGKVLAPKAGFYEDYVILLDFNSLYPSII